MDLVGHTNDELIQIFEEIAGIVGAGFKAAFVATLELIRMKDNEVNNGRKS